VPRPAEPHDYSSRYEIERMKIIQTCVDRIPYEGKTLIEFGCNAGAMTEQFARRFDSVFGIDYEAELVRQATARVNTGNAEFMQYDLNNELPDRLYGRFDTAIALEIIEHLKSPEKFLGQIKRCLRGDARLVISGPNMCSPEAIVSRALCARARTRYTAWDETHVSLFTVGHLMTLLRRNGFEITRLTGYYYGFRVPKMGKSIRICASTCRWPLNRFGFNTIVEAELREASRDAMAS
jgi:2-polyprenyl-3-methyl-5-hydroxy-6-metoxy-1,4-benzoquinol methylase